MTQAVATTNKLSKQDIRKLFWYSQGFVSGFNYEKEEAPGFVFSMMPVIEKVYDNDEDKTDREPDVIIKATGLF